MKSNFLSAILFLHCLSGVAQLNQRKTIHANENLSDYFTWLYPSFEEAGVTFKTGVSVKYKLNFNTFLCMMEFIDPNGDTLEISNPENIDSIQVHTSTFFFKDDYFQIIAAVDSLRLVVSRQARFEGVRLGAMGLPARNVSINDYITYSNSYKKVFQATVNEDLYVHLKTEYFLIDRNGEYMKASKNNFLDLFNDNKKEIQNYLKLNKINFNRQGDLEKLFRFCTHT
ncbi:MAG: hypothetical protein ABI675_02425 [Chitinophagaceae bacterium]